jgi:hypothetical protein
VLRPVGEPRSRRTETVTWPELAEAVLYAIQRARAHTPANMSDAACLRLTLRRALRDRFGAADNDEFWRTIERLSKGAHRLP